MAFTFQQYGTFTGTGTEYIFRDNDDFSNIFEDPVFKLNDVGMALLNTTSDYVYLHLTGSDTSNVTLERNTGALSTFTVNSSQSTFSGNVTVAISLGVTGNLGVAGNAGVNGNLGVLGVLSAAVKSFDIPHPSKDGMRLMHGCLEGPEHAVYIRGRITGSNIITLPDYWKDLVNIDSITVSLTEIGYNQNLVVSDFDDKNIRIKSMCESNIDCFYLVHAERIDVEKLVVETP